MAVTTTESPYGGHACFTNSPCKNQWFIFHILLNNNYILLRGASTNIIATINHARVSFVPKETKYVYNTYLTIYMYSNKFVQFVIHVPLSPLRGHYKYLALRSIIYNRPSEYVRVTLNWKKIASTFSLSHKSTK